MPIYDFICSDCHYQFEDLIGHYKDPNPCCPKCGMSSDRTIGTNIKPIFKGNGFYETDYKNKP